MFKKLICALLMLNGSVSVYSYAQDVSCELQIAVSSPPIPRGVHVSFNIFNEIGVNKSFILSAGNPYKVINNLGCLSTPYSIGATQYEQGLGANQAIGVCTLKAGYILLKEPNSSASVVFPYDFDCH